MRRNVFIVVGISIVAFIMLFVLLTHKGQPQKKVPLKALASRADSAALKGDLIAARAVYKKALNEAENPGTLQELRNKIEDLNIKILFSPVIDSCSIKYIVQPKDTLTSIAHRFNTTVALIKRANGLKSDIIRPGQSLKVNTRRFSIAVDKSQNLLFLKRNDEIVKTYHVSTGKNNCTPVGKLKIVNKLKNPVWFKAGAIVPSGSPKNVLGARWMGLSVKGYGIHGTLDEGDIGKQVTQGCIRMRNKDVKELYDIVPRGTEILIVN